MALPNEVSSLLIGAAANQGSYQIEDSLRFRGSQYLSRTLGTTSSSWTVSFWTKTAHNDNNDGYWFNTSQTAIYMDSSSGASSDRRWKIRDNSTGSLIVSNALIRDPSAWYHVVYKCDGSNRRLYINNSLDAGFTFSGSTTLSGSSTIGAYYTGSGAQLEGYIAEFHFVDGQALNPTDFGEYNNAGVWVPKKYSGSHGTNGFYLDFSDPANIGADRSGNGNNFTASGFELSTTTSTNYDWMADSPTNNYGTFNPLIPYQPPAYANANLRINGNATPDRNGYTTVYADSGLYYVEFYPEGTPICSQPISAGVVELSETGLESVQMNANNSLNIYANGTTYVSRRLNGSNSSLFTIGNSTSANVLQFAVNLNTGYMWFGRDNTWYNSTGGTNGNPATGANPTYNWPIDKPWAPYARSSPGSGGEISANWGQQPFRYTPPSGFEPWTTENLPDVDITNPSEHFNTVLYTGNGSTQSITGVGFQPDFVWIKNRSASADHRAIDDVRGTSKVLRPNTQDAEYTSTTLLTSFDSDGFSLGSDNSGNANNENFVAWCWKKSTTAGFNIVTWSGNDVNGRSIAHGLGRTPGFILVKNYNSSEDWCVWHKTFTPIEVVVLNNNNGVFSSSAYFGGGANEQAPDSTNFYIGSNTGVNGSGRNYIAYVWAEIPGYSSFGNYFGNSSSDGTFVYTGFRPRWVMIRRVNGNNWLMYDTSRFTYNPNDTLLYANFASNESGAAGDPIDILSNGFKMRANSGATNQSGIEYIYFAFAEHPFGGENVSPSPAR
jgi:hypothetical protein